MSTIYNLEIKQGTDYIDSISLKNEDGSIKDLTGCSAYMQIRDYPFSLEARLSASSLNGKLVITPTTGVIQMRFSAADTALLVVKHGVYDLLVVEPSRLVSTIIEGTVTVTPSITRI